MIVVAVLNGWGSSSRSEETRTAALVKEATNDLDRIFLARRSMIGWARSRRFCRFIIENQSPARNLLCVGKSLGGKNMVDRVLNRLPKLSYRKVGLMTIDPCWPIRGDWRPNLNRYILHLKYPVDKAVNVFASISQDQQAGSMLSGPKVFNVPLNYVDHYSIVQAKEVAEELKELIDFINE